MLPNENEIVDQWNLFVLENRIIGDELLEFGKIVEHIVSVGYSTTQVHDVINKRFLYHLKWSDTAHTCLYDVRSEFAKRMFREWMEMPWADVPPGFREWLNGKERMLSFFESTRYELD